MAKKLFEIAVDTDDIMSEFREYFVNVLDEDYGIDSEDMVDDFGRFLVKEAVKPNMYSYSDFQAFAEDNPALVDEIWIAIYEIMHEYMTQKANEFFGPAMLDALMGEDE